MLNGVFENVIGGLIVGILLWLGSAVWSRTSRKLGSRRKQRVPIAVESAHMGLALSDRVTKQRLDAAVNPSEIFPEPIKLRYFVLFVYISVLIMGFIFVQGITPVEDYVYSPGVDYAPSPAVIELVLYVIFCGIGPLVVAKDAFRFHRRRVPLRAPAADRRN